MNPARQFLHILVKDIRSHAPEVGVVLLLNGALALSLTRTWDERVDPAVMLIDVAAQVLLVVAWCALIGRVVQDDGVAGKTPYWLTRPCSRPALLAAKLAFVLLTVHLPNFLCQLVIVTGSGVPLSPQQLLLNQAVIAACLSLPLMALAALTTTFSRFVLGGVAVATVALYVFAQAGRRNPSAFGPAADFNIGYTTFMAAAEVAILALIAVAALVCQFRWRATLRVSAWSLAALSLLGLGMVALPLSYVQRARAAVVGPTTVPSSIRLGDLSERRIIRIEPPLIALPIDSPITFDTIVRHYEVEVRAADGHEVDLVGTGARVLATSISDHWLELRLSRPDYDSLKDSLVSVRLMLEIETYQTRETEPIPIDGSFAIVDGRAQCGVTNARSVRCRTSFGWSRWLYFDEDTAEVQLLWLPLGLRFALNPIVIMQFGPKPPMPLSGPSIATSVREAVSYTRQEVTFENVRLGDWGP